MTVAIRAGAPRLVLASGSPRRREMLRGLGLRFEVRPADIDETPLPGELPDVYVERLARGKARAAAVRRPGDDLSEVVLAADTIVALAGELLGKPRDEAETRHTLRQLAGREHDVFTGVAVLSDADERLELAAGVEHTRVRMAEMTEEEIEWYAASGEPADRAGAYAIQGLGALFVEAVTGNYSNVVGLPLPLTYRLLRRVRFPVLNPRRI